DYYCALYMGRAILLF
nr:immunoglobulin light chain junction region [Macaca mulatta]